MTDRSHLYAHLIGKRVRLTNGLDNYPTVMVNAGETGIVTRFDNDSLWVKMDRHFPELGEWNNELQMWDWEDPDHPLLDDVEVIDFEPFVADAVQKEPADRTPFENDLVILCCYGRSDEARKLWEAR